MIQDKGSLFAQFLQPLIVHRIDIFSMICLFCCTNIYSMFFYVRIPLTKACPLLHHSTYIVLQEKYVLQCTNCQIRMDNVRKVCTAWEKYEKREKNHE